MDFHHIFVFPLSGYYFSPSCKLSKMLITSIMPQNVTLISQNLAITAFLNVDKTKVGLILTVNPGIDNLTHF